MFLDNIKKWFVKPKPIEVPKEDYNLNVIWLHGANQSSLSFEYLRNQTQFPKEILINYSSMNRFYDNLDTITEQCQNKGPHFIIGHSMGGLYALHLTKYLRIIGGVSISTPFRGSKYSRLGKVCCAKLSIVQRHWTQKRSCQTCK